MQGSSGGDRFLPTLQLLCQKGDPGEPPVVLLYMLLCFILVFKFHTVVQAGLDLMAILLPQPLSPGNPGMSQHTRLVCIPLQNLWVLLSSA